MKTLSIDIETYSDVPLQKTGVYRYVESPNFEILLFAYSVDNQPIQVIDLACGEQIPKEVLLALEDESVIKWAFNAAFERINDLQDYIAQQTTPTSPNLTNRWYDAGSSRLQSGMTA